MSDPKVVGIPIGGAVAVGHHPDHVSPATHAGQSVAAHGLRSAARQGEAGNVSPSGTPAVEHFASSDAGGPPGKLTGTPAVEHLAAADTSYPSAQCFAASGTGSIPAEHLVPSDTSSSPTEHLAAYSAGCPQNELPTAADTGCPAGERQPTPRRPIFHLIGEPADNRPAAAAPGSHLEVGVQGVARLSPKAPDPSGARPEVRHPGRALALASVAAIVIGCGFLIRALTLADPVPPPLPPAWAERPTGPVGHRAAPLGYARPTHITVARVGIHADILALGPAPDGAVAVPPTREPLKAAWYDRGPAPGQAGPVVITGHVDSRFAPGHRAAFYELGAVRPGDSVDVTRADHRIAVFRVDSVALVPKTSFPTRDVYGPTSYAALRLITCGGHYDRRTGYADNVIVYAHLVGSR